MNGTAFAGRGQTSWSVTTVTLMPVISLFVSCSDNHAIWLVRFELPWLNQERCIFHSKCMTRRDSPALPVDVSLTATT